MILLWVRQAAARIAGRPPHPAAQLETGAAVGAIILAVGGVFVWLNQFPLNHDTSWYLVATRKWMNGAELYRDIIEVNPPLAFYLTRPGLWIADLVGVGARTGMLLFLSGLICLSLFIVQSLLAEVAITPAQRRGMLAAAAAGLLILPLGVFAQREHIMTVLALPYLIGKMLRPMGLRTSTARDVGLAVFAVAGLCLKPHFLALPLFLTLLEMRRSRSMRPLIAADNLAIGLGVVAYLALIMLLHPAYVAQIIPMAMLVYGAYGLPAINVILNPALAAMLLALVLWHGAAVSGNTGMSGSVKAATHVLAAAVMAFGLSYFVQFTGYRYQSLPIELASLLVVSWILASCHSSVLRRPARAIAAAAVLWLTLGASMMTGHYRSDYLDEMMAALPGDISGRGVMAFSGSVALTFPLVLETGAIWTSRYPALWLIPGAVTNLAAADCEASPQRCEALNDVLAYARDTVVEDFITHRPDLVLVDKRQAKSYFDGLEFDYIDFMSMDQKFAAAWTEYAYHGDILIFEIWQRRPGDR
jgi:hypothetical protein